MTNLPLIQKEDDRIHPCKGFHSEKLTKLTIDKIDKITFSLHEYLSIFLKAQQLSTQKTDWYPLQGTQQSNSTSNMYPLQGFQKIDKKLHVILAFCQFCQFCQLINIGRSTSRITPILGLVNFLSEKSGLVRKSEMEAPCNG